MLHYVAQPQKQQQNDIFAKLLKEFATVFEEPIGLPPMRSHDHQILLKKEPNLFV
jgi:hypothetical protein